LTEGTEGTGYPEGVSFIIHRIWLTDPNQPSDIPEDYTKEFRQTYDILMSSYYPWQFIIWSNVDNIYNLPNCEQIKSLCPATEFRNIEFFEDPYYGKELFSLFLEKKYYANASDVLRYNLVYKYGGIYLDMGIKLTRDISNLYLESDRIFYKKHGNIDICIQSCKYPMKDDLYHTFLEFLENKEWKKYDYNLFGKSTVQNFFTGTEYLQYLLDSEFYSPDTLLVNDGFCVGRKHLDSWQKKWNDKNDINIWSL